MPTINELLIKLNKKDEVVHQASLGDSIESALDKMFKYDFSQLPIVEKNSSFSVITIESILKLLSALGARVSESGIVDSAKTKIEKKFRYDDDLFDLMEVIERFGSALVVDDQGCLKNIITTYDTTQFFQEWSEDIMFVGEIEYKIKDIINNSFKTSDGVIDLDARKQTINEAFNKNSLPLEKFRAGLKYYLKHINFSSQISNESAAKAFIELLTSQPVSSGVTPMFDTLSAEERNKIRSAGDLYSRFIVSIQRYLDLEINDQNINERVIREASREPFSKDNKEVDFDEFTLYEYLQIFFKESWGRFEKNVDLSREHAEYMLDGVRKTRNNLAHFHLDKIQPKQREQLKICYNWLQDNQRQIIISLESSAPPSKIEGDKK
ncbi:MAG: hypothetical protein HY869_10500 [Chloroflexi bacterium]|nr:hypothetical protein [Chloroflexota bacterium]